MLLARFGAINLNLNLNVNLDNDNADRCLTTVGAGLVEEGEEIVFDD
jgi:hypothetical protein